MKLTRRAFLRLLGITTAAGALAGVEPLEAVAEEEHDEFVTHRWTKATDARPLGHAISYREGQGDDECLTSQRE